MTQSGVFTIDYRNGTVTGTYSVTGLQGRVVTGTLSLRAGSLETTATGPNGRTVQVSATKTVNPDGSTLIANTLTGPYGNVYNGSFTVSPR